MIFTEKQSMKKLWGLMVPMLLFVLLIFFIWLEEKDPVEKEKALRALLIASIVGGGLATLFFSMSLHTKISPKGIFFTYSPFKKEKLYKWEDLTALSLGKHKPIKAASLLFPPKNNLKQTVYIVWGKTNVLLRFKNGETMLIGTQKPAEMAAFLKRLKQKYELKQIEESRLNG